MLLHKPSCPGDHHPPQKAEAGEKGACAGAYLRASLRDVYCGGYGKLLLLCHALRERVAPGRKRYLQLTEGND